MNFLKSKVILFFHFLLLCSLIQSRQLEANEINDFKLNADSYCNENECILLNDQEKASIESEVNDILAREIDALDLKLIPTRNNESVILMRSSSFDLKEEIKFVKRTKKEGLNLDGVNLAPRSIINTESSASIMSIQLRPNRSKTLYFAANTYITQSSTGIETTQILMNSIGIGSVRSKHYSIEVGFMKLPKSGYSKEAMKKPDGLVFILRSVFN